jgi:hypothetical protein
MVYYSYNNPSIRAIPLPNLINTHALFRSRFCASFSAFSTSVFGVVLRSTTASCASFSRGAIAGISVRTVRAKRSTSIVARKFVAARFCWAAGTFADSVLIAGWTWRRSSAGSWYYGESFWPRIESGVLAKFRSALGTGTGYCSYRTWLETVKVGTFAAAESDRRRIWEGVGAESDDPGAW